MHGLRHEPLVAGAGRRSRRLLPLRCLLARINALLFGPGCPLRGFRGDNHVRVLTGRRRLCKLILAGLDHLGLALGVTLALGTDLSLLVVALGPLGPGRLLPLGLQSLVGLLALVVKVLGNVLA